MKLNFHKPGTLAIMLLAFLNAYAYDFDTDGVKYTITSLTDLTVAVDGVLNNDVEHIDIPQTVEYKSKNLTVTSIDDYALRNLKSLQTMSLPSSILTIGDKAFLGDSCLITINLPENLTSLGVSVFEDCTSLENISIPNGIKSIPDRIFYGCTSLKTVTLNDNISEIGEAAFNKAGIKNINLPNSISKIGEYAFADSDIESFEMPVNVRNIPVGCFCDCKNLKSVVICSKDIKNIGDWAFADCPILTTINLPQNLESIGDRAFYGCTSLTEFSIPSDVTSISPSILWNCTSLSKLTIGKNLKGLPFNYNYKGDQYTIETLGSYLYYSPGYGIYGPTITNNVHLQALEEVVIEDSENSFSMKTFNDGHQNNIPAFSDNKLKYLYVGRPLTDIREFSYGATRFSINTKRPYGHIKTLEISGSCTENPYFFQGVDTLILGSNIKTFDAENLYTTNLKKIVSLSTQPPKIRYADAIPTNVYTDVILYVPTGCKDAYSSAPGWKNFWNIEELDKSSRIEQITLNNMDKVNVYSIQGNLLKSDINLSDIQSLPKGIYIIVSEKGSQKIKI